MLRGIRSRGTRRRVKRNTPQRSSIAAQDSPSRGPSRGFAPGQGRIGPRVDPVRPTRPRSTVGPRVDTVRPTRPRSTGRRRSSASVTKTRKKRG